jgi:hypothetical protein
LASGKTDTKEHTMATELTDRDKAILTIAGKHYARAGEQLNDLRDLGLTSTGLALELNRLISVPAARAAFPALLSRMERARSSRAIARRTAW